MRTEPAILCGGYTAAMNGAARGIGMLRGAADACFAGTLVEASSPSFLLQRGDIVYAVDEANAAVSVFRLEGGALVALGSQPTSGPLPCHLTADARWLYVSNYGSGSLDVFPIEANGSLGARHQAIAGEGSGPDPAQDGPHAHSTLNVDDVIYSADLGADRVHLHRWVDGQLARVGSIELPPGSGPRDLLSLDGRILVLGELSQRVYELTDGEVVNSGALVGDPVVGDHAAALVADPSGRFLFSCLRGSDRVAVVDAVTLGPLHATSSRGHWPRHLAVIEQRLLVANQLSGDIATFGIDQGSGILHAESDPQPAPSPTFILAAQWPDFVEPDYLIK